MPKNSAMQRWEEQQRLKLMSKKIAGAKSVLKSEKIIGPGGKNSRKNTPSPFGTPYESDDSGYAAMALEAGAGGAKQKKGRPQWQDINHRDYRVEVGSGKKAARVRPARLDIRTPEEARNALIKGLERIEEVVEKAKKSPKKGMQAIAGHFEDLKQMRKDVGKAGSKKKAANAGAGQRGEAEPSKPANVERKATKAHPGVGDAVDMLRFDDDSDDEHEEVEELRKSINALSSLLDSKLKTLQQDADIEDEAPANKSLAEDEVGSPNISVVNRHGVDDSADICQHCEEGDSGDDIDNENVLGTTGADIEDNLGGTGGLATTAGTCEYDDEFEEDEEGDEQAQSPSKIPNDVISALEETASKIELLDSIITKEGAQKADVEQKENNAVNPQLQSETAGPIDAPIQINDLSAEPKPDHQCKDEVVSQTAAQPVVEATDSAVTQAPSSAAEAPAAPAAAPIRPFASKPFSFKAKGPSGAGNAGEQPQIALFSNGITLLNSVNHKPLLSQPSADKGLGAASQGMKQGDNAAPSQGHAASALGRQAPASSAAETTSVPASEGSDRQAGQKISAADIKKAMIAGKSGNSEMDTGLVGKAETNTGMPETTANASAASESGYSMSTARPNRAARGMFLNQPSAELQEPTAPSNPRAAKGLLFSAPAVAKAEPVLPPAIGSESEASAASQADTDSQADSSSNAGSRPVSAGRKKISAAEIKKAMMAKKDGGAEELPADAVQADDSTSEGKPSSRRAGRRLLGAHDPSPADSDTANLVAQETKEFSELPGAMRTMASSDFSAAVGGGFGGGESAPRDTKPAEPEGPRVVGGRMKGRMWQQMQDVRPDASLEVEAL